MVTGIYDVKARALDCAGRFGGDWFAEEYVEGREFNIALLGSARDLRILPMAESRLSRIGRKANRALSVMAPNGTNILPAIRHTVRRFKGAEKDEPALAEKLKKRLRKRSGACFTSTSFVRVDFRVRDGEALILEINVNPCISPDAGFAAAAEAAGMSYDDLIEAIVKAAQ